MKLTIEAVYEKFIGRTDKFPEHFEDFTADIQAYVKQEMREMVGEARAVHRPTTFYERGTDTIKEQNLVSTGFNSCRSSVLTAIENYGKDKGGLM